MVMDGEFEKDSLTGSFSQLLDSVHGGGFDMRTNFAYPSSCFPLGNSPTMLCFEQKVSNEEKTQKFQKPQTQKTYKISGGGGAGGESTSTSSSNNSSGSSGVTKTKRTQCGEPKPSTQERKQSKTSNPKSTTNETTTSSKKPKTTVRKEKLGERIAALQQLVSPFGKTDTASVLHEAMGYIRFLHDQVQVLSSPYLSSTITNQMSCDGVEEEEKGSKYDLKSRGLCLVPLEWTANVASTNGADLWSPVTGGKQGSQPQQQYHGSSLC